MSRSTNKGLPTLIGVGVLPDLEKIIRRLNYQNLNIEGYGRCPACDGYHSYEFGKAWGCLGKRSDVVQSQAIS
jgi:hypothetical protein